MILAMVDQLTQLPNRRHIDSFLSSKYKEFKELDIQFGFLFMDIDKFKTFNDTYGHDVGDDVLKMLSKTFLAATRVTDLVGRFGGEEFVTISIGATLVKEEDTIDAILKRADEMLYKSKENGRNRVTLG